jgi:hypothetical protein
LLAVIVERSGNGKNHKVWWRLPNSDDNGYLKVKC